MTTKRETDIDAIRAAVESRIHRVAIDLLNSDQAYNDRLAVLKKQGVTDYHIDTDILLRYRSGATKVLSDMLTGMSTYLIATEPKPLPGSPIR